MVSTVLSGPFSWFIEVSSTSFYALHHRYSITIILILLFRFCTAGGDKKLRCFSIDLKNNSTVQVLEGHSSYINDCIFSPINGDTIASVSGEWFLISAF